MYHFNKTMTNIDLVHEKQDYYENGRRHSRKIWLTKAPISTEIDTKIYQFILKVTELTNLSYLSKYKLELTFVDNRYLNSLTEMTIYFNGKQPGYSFSLNFTNESNKLLVSMEVYNTTLSENDLYYIKAVLSYQKKKYIDTLQKNMKYILESQLYSDFKIIAGEKTFNVHKAIIAAESNVLRNLLEADMVEKKTGQVKLQGQDPAIVEAALEYIYTKKCNITEKTIEIFKLAHFLELKDLQAECEDYLIGHHVSVRNLMSILEITCLYKSELKGLRAAAIRFMKKNVNAFMNDHFANSLCDYLEMDTVTVIMQISAKCNIDCVIEKLMVYMREHHDELFKDQEFLSCLEAEPNLMMKMLKNSFDVMKIA